MYPPLSKTVEVNGTPVQVELDCGAQSSIISSKLATQLKLQRFPVQGQYQVQGIDGTESNTVTETTAVKFKIGNTPVVVPCFISNHQHTVNQIILGLNFIYDNMTVALNWLETSKIQSRQNMTQEVQNPSTTNTEKKTRALLNPFTEQVNPDHINIGESSSISDPNVVRTWKVSFRKMNQSLRRELENEDVAMLLVRQANVIAQKELVNSETKELINTIKNENSDVIRVSLPDQMGYSGKIVHTIEVIPGSEPTYNRPYRMSLDEQKELTEQLEDLLAAGRIYPTASPYGAPVLFVRKKDGTRRLCCDFRRLNQNTIKSRFPLPLIDELFDQLSGAKWFSSLDLISGYHQIPVLPADQPKTAFVTTRGQYAWRVMPFGLTNAPSTFQMIMQDTLRDYLGKFVLVYLDDILVYSKNKEDHFEHLQLVLDRLRKVGLYAKESKCCFFQQRIKFLGHVIDKEGIRMETSKVVAMLRWPTPKSPTEARRFLGLAGYYRKFVAQFSDIARPLHKYAAQKENWGSTQEKAFLELKRALVKAPVLQPFTGLHKVRVTTDASKEAVGAVLELVNESGEVIGPVAYLSKALINYQLNWPVREKELYAIIHALKTWRHYLKGRTFELRTDHKSLENIMQNYELNERLQNWVSTLMQFDFKIYYIPGETNIADGLSRVSIKKLTFTIGSIEEVLSKKVRHGYRNDKKLAFIIKLLKGEQEIPQSFKTIVGRYRLHNNLLYYGHFEGIRNRLVIPYGELRLELMKIYHAAEISGHPGVSRTYARLAQHYFWKGMQSDVTRFVGCCEVCQKTKNSHSLPVGIFHPLQIPTRRFEAINIDFVSGMNADGIFEQVMVITDRLTKWAISVPLPKKVSTLEIAEILFNNVILQYGIPRFIVSDRDPKFTNSLWEYFLIHLGISSHFSTANNPQSDGQVERLNKTLVEYMRSYTKDNNEWVKYLQIATFAYNTTYQMSIRCSPFLALRGYQERFAGLFNPVWDRPKFKPPRKGDFPRLKAQQAVTNFVENMEGMLVQIRDSIAVAQDQQSKYYNQRHKDLPNYKVGDKILIHKKAYLSSDSRRKFHYIWFGPFTISKVVGDQAVEVKRGELANNKKHNVFNIRYVKKFVPYDSQFHYVPPATLEDLRKNPSQIHRIVDVLVEEEGQVFLVLMDNATELDLIKIPEKEMKSLMSRSRFNYLWDKYNENKTWLKHPVTTPLKG